jgi:hypothetical protein
MELAWVTVPVLVVVFTSMAYLFGFAYRGTRAVLNRLTLAQAWQGVDQSKVTGVFGIYSPNRTTYNVESQDHFLLYPYPDMNANLQGSNNWLSLKDEAGVTLPGVRVEIGGMKSIGLEGSLPSLGIQHDLVLTLSNDLPRIRGKVSNTSKYKLKNAVLVTPSGWNAIGDIGPGQSKDISIDLYNNPSATVASQQVTQNLGWDTYSNTHQDEKRYGSFFEAVTYSSNNVVSVNTGIYLMGVVDGLPAPAGLRIENVSATDTMLYFEKLTPNLEVEPGRLTLPSSIYSWESSLGDSIVTSYYNMADGGYKVRFQPGVPLHFSKVDSLEFNIGTSSTPDKIKAALWNYQTKKWNPISMDASRVVISEPQKYIGMDGEMQLSIDADQNNYVEISSLDFTLTVEP